MRKAVVCILWCNSEVKSMRQSSEFPEYKSAAFVIVSSHRSSGWVRPKGSEFTGWPTVGQQWFYRVCNTNKSKMYSLLKAVVHNAQSNQVFSKWEQKEIQHWDGLFPSLPPLLLSTVRLPSFHLGLFYALVQGGLWLFVSRDMSNC